MSANENESVVSNLSTADEVSRSSAHGSPLTETASLTNEPADFSGLKEEEIDEDVLETHPQNSILNSASADSSRYYIKRPLNAYMIWTRHARDGILKANPHLKMNEMGEMWKKLPEEEKKPFFIDARKSALKHKKALEKYPNLAYVPSKKKIKKGDKPEDPASKEETPKPSSPYPTPSASPHTPSTRSSGFAHPLQTPQTQSNAETSRLVQPTYPQPTIIRPISSTAYSTSVPGTPHVQPYQSEYRPPGGLPAVSVGVPYTYTQTAPQQMRYVPSTPSSQPPLSSFSDSNAVHGGQQVVYANTPFQHPSIPEHPAHFIPNPREQGTYLVRNPFVLPGPDFQEPFYEAENSHIYKELYYRSLIQPLPSKFGQNERETLTPEFYLNRFYSLGGTDPPPHNPAKTSTNTTNGLVYQDL